MKIIFICGTIELGQDGVGDYTRRLASEVILQGHEAWVIAYNDKFALDEKLIIVEGFSYELWILRLPSQWASEKKLLRALTWIEELNVDWISLQFVPYSFNSKGLPLLLPFQLKRLVGRRQVQIMFHEIWIGASYKSSVKVKLISSLQRNLIRYLIYYIRPSLIHTHLATYRNELQGLGVDVNKLPLFSNITPVNINTEPNYKVLRVGFFSQIENCKAMFSLLVELERQASILGKDIEILLIGGNKIKMLDFLKSINQLNEFEGRVKYFGFLDPDELSKVLASCTLGVTPVPRHGLGKSGSVAAFIAHGVPVAAPIVHPGYAPDDIGFFSPRLRAAVLYGPDLSQIGKAKEAALKGESEISVYCVSKKFISDLLQIQDVKP